MTEEEKRLQQDAFDAAIASATAGETQEKPSYAGTFEDQLADLYGRIANREKFDYNVNADPLYQEAKDQYIQQGKLAMRDTMGKAAALTGGYGSSYGQQVGQQAYDSYLKDLSAQIPQLYGAALDKYNQEGDQLLKQYQLLGQQRDAEYGRYRDELSDWMTERAYQDQQADTAYNRQQQAYANLYALILSSGYNPTDAELEAAGMTREAADSLRNEYTRQTTPAATGSSGGGGGGGRSGGGSGYSSGIAQLQQYLNSLGESLDVDGLIGPLTRAAAARHGLNADDYLYGFSAPGGGDGGTSSVGDSTLTPSQVFNQLKADLAAGVITQEEFNAYTRDLMTQLHDARG